VIAGALAGLAFAVDGGGRIFLGLLSLAVLLAGGGSVLRVLLVRLEPPEGRVISRREAPQLYELLDELRRELRSAPFHQVLAGPMCNAAVVQVPRLGVLGWPRNYLLLGLPLMEGQSPGEFRAVLAHEFAHLARGHGRFSRWIYRLRRSWEQVFAQLSRPRREGEVSLRPVVGKFIDWFWPRFNAHAFVLSRANEYEADAVAARLAGAEQLASSLFRSAVHGLLLDEKFWPDFWKSARDLAQPPANVLLSLRQALREGPPAADGRRWIEQSFRNPTTNADTHPCLTDRLRALNRLPDGIERGEFPALSPETSPNAAESFLGAALEPIRLEVEQHWRKQAESPWRERHEKAAALDHRLQALERAVPEPGLDVDSLWDKARVTLELQGDEAAEPLLRQILALSPDHAPANFYLGRRRLGDGHEDGEALLERAMSEDEEAFPQACELLHAHYRRTGRTDRLRELDARMDRFERDLAASRTERRTVTAEDPLIPHGLTNAELSALQTLLACDRELMVADLARKELRHFPKQKLFLLCVQARRAWHRLPDADRTQALVHRLTRAVPLPGRVLVFASQGSFRKLARRLAGIEGARVFKRES
jgi:Zn-dependent protease with chaperone function